MQNESQSSRPKPSLWKGVLAGALGGLIASFAMSEFHSLLPKDEEQPQAADEDSTVKAASAIARGIFHHDLTSDQKKVAGPVVHYAFGSAAGALYGGFVEFSHDLPLGWGLPFGVAVWLGAHVITVPALGLSEPVTQADPGTEGGEFAAHLVYGFVVESVRRALRKSAGKHKVALEL